MKAARTPLRAAMTALTQAGAELAKLRYRLTACDERRYHLSRLAQSINFVACDSAVPASSKVAVIRQLLEDQGLRPYDDTADHEGAA